LHILVLLGESNSLPLLYLSGKFRKALKLMGTPVIIETRTSVNPFKGRKNKLTPGQIRKRKRMFRHVKKK